MNDDKNPAATRRRKLTPWVLLILAGPLIWVVFRLFEPLFAWSYGWEPLPLPRDVALAGNARYSDPTWLPVATKADETLRDARTKLQAPALSAAIMVDGKRVWAAAVGMTDAAVSQPANLESSFRIGSSSKAINALALGRLIDASKFDIERSVRHYVPDLPESYDVVTTRMAISHTAGVPDYGLCLCFPIWEHKNRRHFDGVRSALKVFENRPLIFKPGEGFRYSSYGANVAGAAIEAAAGRPYLEFVADAVFKPLGMTHSVGDVTDVDNPHRVRFYEVTEGKYKAADPVDNSIRYPSGGMLSTPSDMLALGNAFLHGEFLAESTRKLLLTRQKLRDGGNNPQGYALGIRVFDDKKLFKGSVSTQIYSHHGTAVGSTSYFAVYPKYRLVVSMMMNKGQENLDAMAPEADRLVELFIAEKNR